MILGLSTSSPQASVAVFTVDGKLVDALERQAPMSAGATCLELLECLLLEHKLEMDQFKAFLADLGPGSFTGVKVGVTMTKTFAFTNGVQAGGVSSFDLISTDAVVALPSKRKEYFVRVPGEEVYVSEQLPEGCVGYGQNFENPVYPHARQFGELLKEITLVDPAQLLPNYVLEPSISTPKKPYGLGQEGA